MDCRRLYGFIGSVCLVRNLGHILIYLREWEAEQQTWVGFDVRVMMLVLKFGAPCESVCFEGGRLHNSRVDGKWRNSRQDRHKWGTTLTFQDQVSPREWGNVERDLRSGGWHPRKPVHTFLLTLRVWGGRITFLAVTVKSIIDIR